MTTYIDTNALQEITLLQRSGMPDQLTHVVRSGLPEAAMLRDTLEISDLQSAHTSVHSSTLSSAHVATERLINYCWIHKLAVRAHSCIANIVSVDGRDNLLTIGFCKLSAYLGQID